MAYNFLAQSRGQKVEVDTVTSTEQQRRAIRQHSDSINPVCFLFVCFKRGQRYEAASRPNENVNHVWFCPGDSVLSGKCRYRRTIFVYLHATMWLLSHLRVVTDQSGKATDTKEQHVFIQN